jgi:hypothetical protein
MVGVRPNALYVACHFPLGNARLTEFVLLGVTVGIPGFWESGIRGLPTARFWIRGIGDPLSQESVACVESGYQGLWEVRELSPLPSPRIPDWFTPACLPYIVGDPTVPIAKERGWR